jgi:hypothetical protein
MEELQREKFVPAITKSTVVLSCTVRNNLLAALLIQLDIHL